MEQITTTSGGAAADFLVTHQTGVQGVYGSTGSSLEQAQYSLYGKQTITSGSEVTPFGFQGSYTDSTGLIYLVNRYFDPSTDQFLSIDPDVAASDQPYVFTNDDPLNSTDPLGLCHSWNLWCDFQHSRAGGVAVGAGLLILGTSLDAVNGVLLIASSGASLEASAPLAILAATIQGAGVAAITAALSPAKSNSKPKPIGPPVTKKKKK